MFPQKTKCCRLKLESVNSEAARILVMMEADGSFPDTVPVFMVNDEGEETEEFIRIVYWKPLPGCESCVSFGHWTGQCKVARK